MCYSVQAFYSVNYRPEIDGLRAIAVIPVILFHAGLKFLSGGFIGVDIFFVISGYLITMKIIEDLDSNNFCLFNFYEKRARRILPALFVVTIVCVPFAWFLLDYPNLNKFGNALIGISCFVSNIVFWKDQGYFADSSELNPLLHTWSLSVEEQYYLFFPLLLLFFWRFGKRTLVGILLILIVASICLSEWVSQFDYSANFYLAPTRMWEILVGSVCAVWVNKYGVKNNEILSTIGILTILASFFVYTPNTHFPSLYTILPVLGVVMLVMFCGNKTLTYSFLSSKFLVGVGLLSYSAYLWHQPLFAFYRIYSKKIDLSLPSVALLIALTFIFAVVSWKYIEQPFRKRKNFSSMKIFLFSIAICITIATIGYFSKLATNNYEYSLASKLESNKYIYFSNMDERKFIQGRLSGDLKNADVVCVGSSRLMQINSTMIEGEMYNFSVSGASVEDLLAISLESIAKLKSNTIYIGLDPWIMNVNNMQDRYKSIIDLYDYWLKEVDKNDSQLKPFLADYNQIHKKDSLEFVLHELYSKFSKTSNSLIPLNDSIEAIAKKSYDGSHIYDSSYSNLGDQLIYKQFNDWIDYGMYDFVYDNNSEYVLLKLLKYLCSRNIDINLFLSPYHPDFFKLIETERPEILEIEERFRNIAKKLNINIIGTYDPNMLGISADDFYDGIHPKGTALEKILGKS